MIGHVNTAILDDMISAALPSQQGNSSMYSVDSYFLHLILQNQCIYLADELQLHVTKTRCAAQMYLTGMDNETLETEAIMERRLGPVQSYYLVSRYIQILRRPN